MVHKVAGAASSTPWHLKFAFATLFGDIPAGIMSGQLIEALGLLSDATEPTNDALRK